jgi:uncharacterized protein (DUF2252 family)
MVHIAGDTDKLGDNERSRTGAVTGAFATQLGRGDDQQDRRAVGKSARQHMRRSSLARWARPQTFDPLSELAEQDVIRRPDLLPIRYGRMAVSSWAFYRGAAATMAADLATRPHSGLTVQLCGDAHVLNFGLWATPERHLSFDLRDFDETLPGPFEWDLCRLVASLAVLARDTRLDEAKARRAVHACLAAYRARMKHFAGARHLDIWYDLVTADQFIDVFEEAEHEHASRYIAREARRRTSRGSVKSLTERPNGELRIVELRPLRTRLPSDELALAGEVYSAYRDSLSEDRRLLLDRFTFVDAVRQVVGVGSVGMRVYLVLLQGRDSDDPLFVQIKQAGPSVYETHLRTSRHPNHGQRVVVGKRLIQSATDIFSGWTAVAGNDYYVRQFRDMKVVPTGQLIAPHLAEFATACGAVLARAHARTGDPEAIAGYIGRGDRFDQALTTFAFDYADQTARDHQALVRAVGRGTVTTVDA